jgi:hypothetical protein
VDTKFTGNAIRREEEEEEQVEPFPAADINHLSLSSSLLFIFLIQEHHYRYFSISSLRGAGGI